MFDDELIFADEEMVEKKSYDGSYKVLIVDDEEQIHKVTKISLDNFEFNNKNIEFLSAYSSKEAKEILEKNSDIVLVLLDVVMESDTAGLELVKTIREEYKNNLIRIVLRTGQPGMAPEENVIKNYDINDYKAKTELTSTKLFTTVISAIRAYENINLLLSEQKENQRKEDLLLQQSKLAMLGEMLGMITHQWRQPLSNISANVSGALLSIQLDNFKKNAIIKSYNDVIDQVHFMSSTIDDFKNFFKPNKLKQSVKIEDVYIKSMTIMRSILCNSNIKVEEDFQANSPISIYFNELIQVFLNIINNAKDAIISNNVEDGQISIKSYEDEKNSYIEISDNAGGISDKIIENVFNAYFTTKGNDGSGLGLYMSKIIIEEHLNGKLEVMNIDSGVQFKITLPKEIK